MSQGTPATAGSTTGSTTLLLADPMTEGAERACLSCLTGTAPERTALVFVALARSPDATLRWWDENVDARPAQCGIVAVGEGPRAAAAGATRDGRKPVRVRTVAEPGDLTGLTISAGEVSEAVGEGHHVAVCIDSLTPVLLATDERRAFRFLHVLTQKLTSQGATVHAHLDPNAHEDTTVATIRSLFERVVTPDG